MAILAMLGRHGQDARAIRFHGLVSGQLLTSNNDTNEKILWFLVVFFLHILGAIIYFVAGRSKRAGTLSTT